MLSVIRQLDILLYPPAINILLLLVALIVWRRRHLAKTLVSVSLATLFLFSLPAVSHSLLYSLEDYPALLPSELESKKAQAIVVLGGGLKANAVEYGGAALGKGSLIRVRYAAFIQRKTNIPVLFTGGSYLGKDLSEARTAKQTLNSDFNIKNVITENKSRTTRENARMTADILKKKNIRRIFLVTNSWHMKRAVKLFEGQDIEIIPAPTDVTFSNPLQWRDFIPNGDGLSETRVALHEYLGRLLYFL